MLISLLLLLYSGEPASALQKTVDLVALQMPQFLSSITGSVSACNGANQYVSSIRIHPKGGAVQVYTLQVLDSANTWQTLNLSGIFQKDKDSDWIPLTAGLNRCISQVLIYGNIIPTPNSDNAVKLVISAQLNSTK